MQYHEANRYREEYGYRVVCIQCHKLFDSKRGDASFCNSTCRSKYSRAKKKRQLTREKFEAALTEMLLQLPRRGQGEDFEVLQKAATRIQNSLSWVEMK